MTLNPATFDRHGLLNDLEQMFWLRAEAKPLRFTVERNAAVPRLIVTDHSKLREVLINLLSNAFAFTDKG